MDVSGYLVANGVTVAKVGDVLAGCKVMAVFNGIPLRYERRRYGQTTYTWLFWWQDGDWRSAGDPWPSINIPKSDLKILFCPSR